MSSLEKSKHYEAMRKSMERYSGDPIAVSAQTNGHVARVEVQVLLGGDSYLFADHLAEAIKRRGPELMRECLAEAKRQAIDQAENVARSASSTLERLKQIPETQADAERAREA